MLRRAPRSVAPVHRPARVVVPRRNYCVPGYGINPEIFLYVGAIGTGSIIAGYTLTAGIDFVSRRTEKYRISLNAKKAVRQEERDIKRGHELKALRIQFEKEYLELRKVKGLPENTAMNKEQLDTFFDKHFQEMHIDKLGSGYYGIQNDKSI